MTTPVGAALSRIDINVVAGARLDITIPILSGVNQPVSILDATGWVVAAQVRTHWSAPTALHTWTSLGATPNGVIVTGVAAAVRLTATPAETAGWQQAWPRLVAPWDLWVTQPGTPPDPHPVVTGLVHLTPAVTRS